MAAARATCPVREAGDDLDPRREALGEEPAQFQQNVGLGFKEIFVEVVVAASAAAEGEISVQQGDLGDSLSKLLAGHK